LQTHTRRAVSGNARAAFRPVSRNARAAFRAVSRNARAAFRPVSRNTLAVFLNLPKLARAHVELERPEAQEIRSIHVGPYVRYAVLSPV
jgi:hypothetical protein